MDDQYKLVFFNEYCEKCRYFEKMEEEEPCYSCLAEPVNLNSRKPVKWEEK